MWTDLSHIRLGLPVLLFPCGFQSKAFLSMASFPFLSVCPIQFHFRLLICVDISVSSLLQNSSFEITSGQRMFRILRKQRLTKVCSSEVVVFIPFHLMTTNAFLNSKKTPNTFSHRFVFGRQRVGGGGGRNGWLQHTCKVEAKIM